MAQSTSSGESKERAVSSEPCSTRPNPFDDSDISSRKRQRTSLSGASRSRSAEPVDSPQGSIAMADLPPEPRSDSAMGIDSYAGAAAATTPEPEQPQSTLPPSGPRSSRVTINVRTPSRLPDGIPSSPASPTRRATSPAGPINTVDTVHLSVEESEMEMARDDTAVVTPISEEGSPPVEIISIESEGSEEPGAADPEIRIIQEMPRSVAQDPIGEIPFFDTMDPSYDIVNRLLSCFFGHVNVPRSLANWIDRYLFFYKPRGRVAILRSYHARRPFWNELAELVQLLVSRKVPYPDDEQVRDSVFAFYQKFALLTALFVGVDVQQLPSWDTSNRSEPPTLLSPPFVQALAMLTRKDEVEMQSQVPPNHGKTWRYADEVMIMLDIFLDSCAHNRHCSIDQLSTLGFMEWGAVRRFPKLVDSVAYVCLLICNLLLHNHHKLQSASTPQSAAEARTGIARGYNIFVESSTELELFIEKNVNHLSQDAASVFLVALTEIYRITLSVDKVVPAEIVKDHRANHPELDLALEAEAISTRWKLAIYNKLIKSSQMQLRVMAVTAMCHDLVGIYRMYNNEQMDMSGQQFLKCISRFLLESELVTYILGPTCHPEITAESGNIIGFLVVSGTYTDEHTDALWRTVISTQDPRVSDALIRMTARITNLFTRPTLVYLCEKLNTVPVDAFSPTMRELCEAIFRYLPPKTGFERAIVDPAPYDLCVRLIRESSVLGHQTPTAYPEVQHFATQKLKELLAYGPDQQCRRRIYAECMEDIAQKSQTTIGSLWVLALMVRQGIARDLHYLTEEHDLPRLLVDELEAAISTARSAGFTTVLSGAHNSPRKELITGVVTYEPLTITNDFGPRLWDLLVGSAAFSSADRDVAWQILIGAHNRSPGENPFTNRCFTEYLSTLKPDCFCAGTLDFLREIIIPMVDDVTSILLDDQENPDHAALEQLWQMVLTAPPNSIEEKAIQTLVKQVYIDSRSIMAFTPYRATKVHLALVNRCLSQLSSAASKLDSSAVGPVGPEDDAMEVIPTEQQLIEQKLLFTRSLSVLREFHRLHRVKPQFSAPDMRSLILDSPEEVNGESAELKYQAFDGNVQTSIAPLTIGKCNTAASLLASLRDATGFSHFRMYYKGRPLVPREIDIIKPLEELGICNDLILVKREVDAHTPETRTRAGASPVEVEILGHFKELWGYLGLEENLAQGIYSFLVKLPADENMMKATADPSTPYQAIFPLGQPFKSLYAIYALKEHLAAQRRQSTSDTDPQQGEDTEATGDTGVMYSTYLLRAMKLVVSAISDEAVIANCSSQVWKSELSCSLLECFLSLLADPHLPESAVGLLDKPLLSRLLNLLGLSLSSGSLMNAPKHLNLCLRSILDPCTLSEDFISAFCADEKISGPLQKLLLCDPRKEVRASTALVILQKVRGIGVPSIPSAVTDRFRDLFWPIVSNMIRSALECPKTSIEVLELCVSMLTNLRETRPQTLDAPRLIEEWMRLLLWYSTFEDVTQPSVIDTTAMNFIRLLHILICPSRSNALDETRLPRNIAHRIFWKHLFPPFDKATSMHSRPILHTETRNMLIEIILCIAERDRPQLEQLLLDLNELVMLYPEDEANAAGELYPHELQHQFERAKAVRAPCGYVGLRNLSNTCYFNSLFTQLFMNIDFRQFVTSAEVRDTNYSQKLLFEIQKLFSFMQDSIRRFVTPEECIASITTPDGPIDVSVQMDVDEFFNTLFDRWEGQFLGGAEKQRFRTFYGGQLVQQVKSKECEHISERLEPFSAIQCDIKGKSSLYESLQAYVDGEIMEGENKYKCGTCNRHVDAVKRACLKEIPDNLIFHLKRFDFNLKQMQRFKINDYFSFPTKIDMRPYTIDHLSNPSELGVEDVFELVGVLVHSGNAETGHYYSYIRERPSGGEDPVWIEFNDDVVSSWDPALMESSCFGGPDYRHFDNNGGVFDKTYSAYMLFFQRSSSLAKQQQLLEIPGATSPYRVKLSSSLQNHIELENVSILRRHCLYDPSQIQFVNCALQYMKDLSRNGCSGKHEVENLGLTVAMSYLDQVASRTKDIPDFFTLLTRISDSCRSCVRCSLTVFEYSRQYPETVRVMMQKNPDVDVREGTGALILQALQVIKAQLPAQYGIDASSSGDESEDEEGASRTVIEGMMEFFALLWENFHASLRSWPEVFGFMLSFVKMGRHEMGCFLEQPFLRMLLLIISADTSLDLPSQYVRMITTINRRVTSKPASYDAIISLIDVLTSKMSFMYDRHFNVWGPDLPHQRYERNNDVEQRYWFTKAEAMLIHTDWARGGSNIFVDKLISINQNETATHSILANFVRQGKIMQTKVYHTLRAAISGQMNNIHVEPYLRVGSKVLCRFASDPAIVDSLIAHVCQQCMNIQNADGMAFFNFQRDVFDGPRESGESRFEILMTGYSNIPLWAPGLLGSFEPAVVAATEDFLSQMLFRNGPSPELGLSEEAKRRSAKVDETARNLGFKCLIYMRDNYVDRGGEVHTRLVAALERTIKECAKFFEGADDRSSKEFHQLMRDVLEPLSAITVDDLEEDGSGMLYSDSSSVLSSNTAG
ncbi:ubiquitin carboxyl-terminal hydrolase 34 [Echria macrotheca]|uniref:Ubiquitin carboxyl-terminal hydrolase 34 n=1 Tax=Echria macrotheca TaxID=438768 RepID=A0AAJ0B4T7_9PEZI|nr:ubiquitin carboxyl-terminal hydrolase 34 [Echria macrotheca]